MQGPGFPAVYLALWARKAKDAEGEDRMKAEEEQEKDWSQKEEGLEEKPLVLEEIVVEDLTIDGICGVY